MAAATQPVLVEAADQARQDGWLRWEADEYVASVLRKLDLEATAARIAAAVTTAYGEGGE